MSEQTKFLFLQKENIPCWYEIGFDSKTPAILVKVHRDFLQFLPLLKDSYIVESFMKDFGFSEFYSDILNGNFGFERAFKRIGEKDQFIVFSVEIPVLEKSQLVSCSHCQGSKKDLFGECSFCNGSGTEKKMKVCSWCQGSGKKWTGYDEDCNECNGSGRREDTIMDWHSFYAISATFSLFFELMSFGQDESKIVCCKFPQLILVNTFIQKGVNYSAPLDGTYSIPLVNWLASFPSDTEIREMTSAMVKTWKKIHGRFDDLDKMNTWAKISGNNGWLSINCPGDRTSLYPSHNYGLATGRGYEFSCHNVDSPTQQLTLLAGLSALCDKARREIK